MDLHHYYKENKDRINSSIMEIACDLAEKYGKNPDELVEPENPDAQDNGKKSVM